MDRQINLEGESLCVCVCGALWKGGKEINNLKIQFWSNELRADVMMGSMQELQVGQWGRPPSEIYLPHKQR